MLLLHPLTMLAVPPRKATRAELRAGAVIVPVAGVAAGPAVGSRAPWVIDEQRQRRRITAGSNEANNSGTLGRHEGSDFSVVLRVQLQLTTDAHHGSRCSLASVYDKLLPTSVSRTAGEHERTGRDLAVQPRHRCVCAPLSLPCIVWCRCARSPAVCSRQQSERRALDQRSVAAGLIAGVMQPRSACRRGSNRTWTSSGRASRDMPCSRT